jgi:hypothetical protein
MVEKLDIFDDYENYQHIIGLIRSDKSVHEFLMSLNENNNK